MKIVNFSCGEGFQPKVDMDSGVADVPVSKTNNTVWIKVKKKKFLTLKSLNMNFNLNVFLPILHRVISLLYNVDA